MTSEVKEEQPAQAQAENGVTHEETKPSKEETKEANGTTNGATNGNGNGHHEEDNGAENGNDAKHNESISELAASVKQRQRKQVERFLPTLPQSEDRAKDFAIPKGQGVKFGELDNVEFRISRTDPEDLKPLHRILYGTVGKNLVVRKNLRAFSGFDFEKTSKEYEKKMEQIKRFTIKGMKFVLQLLDLETKGEREELEQRLMDFLMNPQPSGKKSLKEAAKEAKEKKSKKSEKKKAAAEKKKEKTVKKKAASEKKKKSPVKKAEGEGKGKKRPAPTSDVESDSEKSDSDSDSDSSDGNESDTSATSAVSKGSSSASPSPAKRAKPAAAPKKSPAKSPAKKPAAAKSAKSPAKAATNSGEPTDDELHSIISDFVSGADLETVTMKNVIAHVFAKYPAMDLTNRKPWIKETVKQLVAAAP